MNRELDDYGKLLLRLLVGGLIILHGIHKITHGIGGIETMVTAYGWPSTVAYGVYIGEVIGPILVILGVFTRPGAFFILVNMAVAVLLVHSGEVLARNGAGGWAIELDAFFGIGAIVIMLLGAGRFSLGGYSRWN